MYETKWTVLVVHPKFNRNGTHQLEVGEDAISEEADGSRNEISWMDMHKMCGLEMSIMLLANASKA